MPINTLYHTWFQWIQDLRPRQRITQIRNFVWLIVGIYQSRSVCLSRIAGKIPSSAKLLSMTRRLSRLLANPAIRVREWYDTIGTRTVRNGLRDLVDRTDRRDLSIFQIGLRFIERCVINALSYRILLCSYR